MFSKGDTVKVKGGDGPCMAIHDIFTAASGIITYECVWSNPENKGAPIYAEFEEHVLERC